MLGNQCPKKLLLWWIESHGKKKCLFPCHNGGMFTLRHVHNWVWVSEISIEISCRLPSAIICLVKMFLVYGSHLATLRNIHGMPENQVQVSYIQGNYLCLSSLLFSPTLFNSSCLISFTSFFPLHHWYFQGSYPTQKRQNEFKHYRVWVEKLVWHLFLYLST